MNILLLTPLYKISGRESLERNTEAIHHLVKYWENVESVNLYVVNTYLNPGRNIKFLLKRDELKHFRDDYEYVVDGVNVYLTEIQQIPFQKKFWKFQNRKMINAVNNVIINKQFNPDIIIAHFPVRYLGVIEKIKSDAPRIAVLHFTDIRICKKYPHYVSAINNIFTKVYARSASIRNMADEIGIERLSDFIINSGVPQEQNVIREKERNIDRWRILYVGKLIERKHPEYIVKALSKLIKEYDFEMRFVGSGPIKNNLERLVHEGGLEGKTSFFGVLPREKVFEEMANADIFIMPSVQETLGLVYLEAMCQGCITIGTEGEGIDGVIVNGKNGFLVRPLSEDSVYQCLKYVFDMPSEERKRISEEAVKSGGYYNEKDMSIAYLREMESFVEGAKS